jgi:hypothetical protein
MPYSAATLIGAAGAGAVYKLVWLHAMCEPQDPSTTRMVAYHAVRAGSVAALEWLKRTQQDPLFHRATCETAAEYKQLSVLQYLQSEGCRWDGGVLSAAAKSGAFELLRWAVEHGCPWQEFHVDDSGNFVPTADPNSIVDFMLEDAAAGGDIELLEWLKQQLPQQQYDEGAMRAAVEGGHVTM